MNKKNKLILVIIICCVFILLSLLLYYFGFSKSYAYIYEDKMLDYNNNPMLYVVDTACQNADSRWDYSKNRVIISNVKGTVSCDVDFKLSSNYTTLASYVMSLAGVPGQLKWDKIVEDQYVEERNVTNNETGITVSTGYRYTGITPNNYVWFNNERWRIIGVFDDEFHNQTGKYLVKLIKDTPLTDFSYGNRTVDFEESDLYNFLNNYYYYNSGDTYGRNACNAFSDFVGYGYRRCDYSKYGITDWYSFNMIENVTWYTSTLTDEAIGLFDQDTFLFFNVKSTAEYSYTGYISVPNSSDYALSSRQYPRYYERYFDDWLVAITPKNSYTSDKYFSSNTLYRMLFVPNNARSNFNLFGADLTIGHIFPTLYLKEGVFIRSGTGSYDDPFILELNK